jgi:O-antigen biosynthesis protein
MKKQFNFITFFSLLQTFLGLLFSYLWKIIKNPHLYLWIATNMGTTKSQQASSQKDSFFKRLFQMTLNRCDKLENKQVYELWIKKVENKFLSLKLPLKLNINVVRHGDLLPDIGLKDSYTLILSDGAILHEQFKQLINKWFDALPSLPDFAYADFDFLEQGKRSNPQFQMKWNPYFFLAINDLGPVLIVENIFLAHLVDKVGGRIDFNEIKHMILEEAFFEKRKVCHIPFVIGHILEKNSGKKDNSALIVSLAEKFTKVIVKYEVDIPKILFSDKLSAPLVSIIIPTSSNHILLQKNLESLEQNRGLSQQEIIIVANNPSKEAEKLFSTFGHLIQQVVEYDKPFNFAEMNNEAVGFAKGDFLCFLNDDTEVITPGWIDFLVSPALIDGVGAVGPKLLYADGTLQHCGVHLGINGISGHKYRGQQINNTNRRELTNLHEVASLTAACMVVSKELFLKAEGFDPRFSHTFNDLDFCLRLREMGLVNLVVPYVELYHYEGITRGSDFEQKNAKRYIGESVLIKEKWGALLNNDPYLNENLSLLDEQMKIRVF